MKMCSRHIGDLTEVIRKKGMSHLVSSTESMVRDRAQKWLAGTATDVDFDPLIGATFEINKKAQELVGGHFFSPHDCPICGVSRAMHQDVGPSWIDNVTDLMLIVAKTNNIM